MNNYQRVTKKLREEEEARQPAQQPMQPGTDESPVNGLEDVFAGLSRQEAEELVEEYISTDGLKSFIAAKRVIAEQKQQETNQDALRAQYEAELAKVRPGRVYEVNALQRAYRAKGLRF